MNILYKYEYIRFDDEKKTVFRLPLWICPPNTLPVLFPNYAHFYWGIRNGDAVPWRFIENSKCELLLYSINYQLKSKKHVEKLFAPLPTNGRQSRSADNILINKNVILMYISPQLLKLNAKKVRSSLVWHT